MLHVSTGQAAQGETSRRWRKGDIEMGGKTTAGPLLRCEWKHCTCLGPILSQAGRVRCMSLQCTLYVHSRRAEALSKFQQGSKVVQGCRHIAESNTRLCGASPLEASIGKGFRLEGGRKVTRGLSASGRRCLFAGLSKARIGHPDGKHWGKQLT